MCQCSRVEAAPAYQCFLILVKTVVAVFLLNWMVLWSGVNQVQLLEISLTRTNQSPHRQICNPWKNLLQNLVSGDFDAFISCRQEHILWKLASIEMWRFLIYFYTGGHIVRIWGLSKCEFFYNCPFTLPVLEWIIYSMRAADRHVLGRVSTRKWREWTTSDRARSLYNWAWVSPRCLFSVESPSRSIF